MSTCPNGHASAADDYCDVCGARIGGAPSGADAAPPADASPAGAPAADDVTCPHCGITQDAGHRFCEVCGADLTTGAPAPATPVAPTAAWTSAPPASPTPTPAAAGPATPDADATGTSGAAPTGAPPRWEALVEADRAYFDRLGVGGVEFPVAAPARTFALVDANVLVGRRSVRRGIAPQIDLAGAPEDPGVSHAHCTLVRQPDGSYAVVDNGSTNGTRVNEATEAVEPNRPVPLADGDRVHVGAWTTITLRRR